MKTTIEDKKNEVINLKKELADKEGKIIEAIYNLKKIMLNEKNHEDNLINKKLKIKPQGEYKSKFEELIKAKDLINDRNRVKDQLYNERKELVELIKKDCLNEEKRIAKNTSIENRRFQILEKTCQFVREHGMIQKGIEELENLKKNKINN